MAKSWSRRKAISARSAASSIPLRRLDKIDWGMFSLTPTHRSKCSDSLGQLSDISPNGVRPDPITRHPDRSLMWFNRSWFVGYP
jgi:hypothetical protein